MSEVSVSTDKQWKQASKRNIVEGSATVPYDPLKDGWVLPGCVITKSKKEAILAAKRIDDYIKTH